MTVANLEMKVRRILQDDHAPYRWESAEIRDSLQDGVDALAAIRPEIRYVNGELIDRIILPPDDEGEIDVEDRFSEALVYYVAYRCFLDDATDTTNQQLVDLYLQKFNAKAQL